MEANDTLDEMTSKILTSAHLPTVEVHLRLVQAQFLVDAAASLPETKVAIALRILR